ncbi:MAG: hypothetical protein BV457_00275 [Thermoplasmata archaeon M9B1D]|nr:MAG: hypothetical protein BV457_00275 [Thermoplasmata archaeon M9B1D]PNX52199.1 MAG: hypothetical protein BV456_00020 [Thermoplasmata archaeon M8B2D]
MTDKINNKTFKNAFKALSWCYENPMKEIEYDRYFKESNKVKRRLRINKEKILEINDDCHWSQADLIVTEFKNWQNIKVYEEPIIIKTKEDFKDKYIEVPKDIDEEIFDKIKKKFNRIGFSFYRNDKGFSYKTIIECPYIWVEKEEKIVNSNIVQPELWNLEEISVEDFLREEEEEFRLGKGNIYFPNEEDYTIALCESCDTEVKVFKGAEYCHCCGEKLFGKEEEKPIWSADDIALFDDLLQENCYIFDIKDVHNEGYKTKKEIVGLPFNMFKTKERAELERDRREVDYIMKKMACLSRKDNSWKRILKTEQFDVSNSTLNKCGFIVQENTKDYTHIGFNKAYFNTEQDAQKCLDCLLEKYGEDRLKEIWGIIKIGELIK